MRTDVVTAAPTTAIGDVARQMREENVGSVVVVEEDRPVGIVTDRDLAIGPFADGAPDDHAVREPMTPDPVTVPRTAGVMEACEAISENAVRRLPVVEEGGALAGILTLDDLHVFLSEEQHDLATAVSTELRPY